MTASEVSSAPLPSIGIRELIALLNRLPALVAYVDRDLVYRFVNDAYREYYSPDGSDIVGRPVRDVLGDAAFAQIGPHVDRVLGGEDARISVELPHPREGKRWLSAVYAPDTAEDGRVRGYLVVAWDSTQQRAAEAKARAERGNLERLFEQAPAAIAILEGPDLVYTLSNALNQKYAGGRSLVGRPLAEALPEVPALHALAQHVYRTGEPFVTNEIASVVQDDDGPRELIVAGTYQPLRDADGAVAGIMAFAYEVTEQVKARRIAEDSERRLRALAEALPAIVWAAEADGRNIYYNRRWYEFTGQNPQDESSDAIHPDERDAARVRWEHSLATGEPWEAEYRLRAKDGNYRWFLGRLVPTRDEQGKVVHWYGTAVDIDNQKRAEARLSFLARASKLLASTLDVGELSSRIVALVVPEVADACALRLVNDARVAGSAGEPAPGSSLLNVPLLVQEHALGELVLERRGGRARFEPADVMLAQELGRRVAIALQHAQLLEQREAERKRAEEASRAKDDFLAMVSHELRSPLHSMLGWTTMMRTSPLDETKRARALAIIERSARVQAQLIEDLLDVTRIDAGKLRLQIAPFDLRTVLDAAIDTVKPAADAKGIAVEVAFDDGAREISGDASRVQQIIWNLVSNAVKFSKRGDVVSVRVTAERGAFVIEVSDTGQGIANEFLPHVFERFRQAEAGSTRSKGGLGLGLTIAKHLVELHGGSIAARSEGADRGATFTVSLPRGEHLGSEAPRARTRAATTTAVDALATLPSLAGMRVLVVDDEPDARELLRVVLESAGASVETASSAAEAFSLFGVGAPQVLVSDISMPGEDGYSLIERVRALPDALGGRVPAIALTAHARAEDRTRALLAGFDMHVAKPIEPTELVLTLARLHRLRART